MRDAAAKLVKEVGGQGSVTYKVMLNRPSLVSLLLEADNGGRKAYAGLNLDLTTGKEFEVTDFFVDNDNVKATMNIFQTGLPKPVITVDNKEMFTNLASKEDSILLKYKATNTKGPRDLTIDIDKNDQDWISFKPAIDAKGDSTFLVSVKENTGGERTATIALCAAADPGAGAAFKPGRASARSGRSAPGRRRCRC